MAKAIVLVAAIAHAVHATLPQKMKAGALTKKPWFSKITPEDFSMIEVSVPAVKDDEILVKVSGSSINPIDYKELEIPFLFHIPHVIGRDCAGVVVAVGKDTTRFKIGDRVWANNDKNKGGNFAEYAAIPESYAGHAPSSLPLSDAAVLPLVALTGVDAFKFAGGPWPQPKTVVVLGGSGGVGHVSIQIAKAFGADKVITTCGTGNLAFCKSLGADQVLDYHKAKFHEVIAERSVDVVFDTVGITGTGSHAFDILKDGGFYITTLPTGLANPVKMLERPKVKQEFVFCDARNVPDLDTLRDLVDSGKLQPHIDKNLTFAHMDQVINASMGGHTVGKIAVRPPDLSPSLVV